ncbi:MAG: ATP-binding cassette domain-containing protein [Lachnospiraceae bacterium]|jgi:peptide/nickel transport system ATP-binding protein|nr:ATP-binding cassette domain-containing protein [Lachnospiraceae bacterium]
MENKQDKKVLLHLEDLKQYFPVKKGMGGEQLYVKANDGISLDIYEGETFGLVGESGCGKSTLGRVILQLYHQTAGRTLYYGRDIDEMAPHYVEDTLKNLPDRKKKWQEAVQKEAAAKAHYEAQNPDSEEGYQALEAWRAAQREEREQYLDIVELIGGFFVSDNLAEVSPILLKEHKLAAEGYRLRTKIHDLQVAFDAKPSESKKNKIDKNQELLEQNEKELSAAREEIYRLLETVKKHPDYEKHAAYRDKGVNLAKLSEKEIRFLRKDLQLIFQDPYSSLNPRMTVGQIIGEGLLAHKYFQKNDEKMQDYILQTMEDCGLAPYFIHRYPHQFSGGQRQRIGIARSLALKPKFVVCDEAVSALDVSIQSQVINLLLDLKEKENLTYLFISHDLSVIKYISDRVGVMYLGNMVELATTEELYEHPTHPYTEALLSAIPTTDLDDNRETIILEGDIPSPIKPPTGCKFHTRCRYCTDICKQVTPVMDEVAPGHFVACHHKLGIYSDEK